VIVVEGPLASQDDGHPVVRIHAIVVEVSVDELDDVRARLDDACIPHEVATVSARYFNVAAEVTPAEADDIEQAARGKADYHAARLRGLLELARAYAVRISRN
jgi:hypothetical protein